MKLGIILSLYIIAIFLTVFTSKINVDMGNFSFNVSVNFLIALSPLLILTFTLMIIDMIENKEEWFVFNSIKED